MSGIVSPFLVVLADAIDLGLIWTFRLAIFSGNDGAPPRPGCRAGFHSHRRARRGRIGSAHAAIWRGRRRPEARASGFAALPVLFHSRVKDGRSRDALTAYGNGARAGGASGLRPAL